jgi:hypothetical protein
MEKDSVRRKELVEFVGNEEVFGKLIDEMVFLEANLRKLRELPMIKVDPNNPVRQKATPASKLYKEMLQQYTNIIKTISKGLSNDEVEESPLRKYFEELRNAD